MMNYRIVPRRFGFALISTMSVLTLLVMVALSMLSLSTVSTNVSVNSFHYKRARANARMALVEAISILQQQLGPDKRVSAPAAVLATNGEVCHPYYCGVWDSWGGSMSVEDVKASYLDKSRGKRFRRWLVSGGSEMSLNTPLLGIEGEMVELLAEGSLGAGVAQDKIVAVPKVQVDQGGAYAWWISDEGQKSKVNLLDRGQGELNDHLKTFVSAPANGVESIGGLEHLTILNDLDRAVSVDTLNLMDARGAGNRLTKGLFHDITVNSMGLFTSVNRGGLKKDLNLLLGYENFENPTVKHTNTLPFSWRSQIFPGGVEWWKLKDCYDAYKSPDRGGYTEWINGVPHVVAGDSFEAMKNYNHVERWQDKVPYITEWSWLFSHYAVSSNSYPNRQYIRLVIDSIAKYWNPYTIPMKVPDDVLVETFNAGLPYSIRYYHGGNGMTVPKTPIAKMIMGRRRANGRRPLVRNYLDFSGAILGPGEVKVYTNSGNEPRPMSVDQNLVNDWNPKSGMYIQDKLWEGKWAMYAVDNPNIGTDDVLIEFDIIGEKNSNNNIRSWAGPSSLDFHCESWIVNRDNLRARIFYRDVYSLNSIQSTSPSIEGKGSFVVGDVIGSANKKPAFICGLRTKIEKRTPLSNGSVPTASELAYGKHLLYTAPVEVTTGIYNADNVEGRRMLNLSPFEFYVQKVDTLMDTPLIDISPEGKGYIGTGRSSFDGQSHVPIRELAYIPMISIGQLQHAKLGYTRDVPRSWGSVRKDFPHVSYAFGNSFANPFVKIDAIEAIGQATGHRNPVEDQSKVTHILNDKSWKANVAIWDDFYMSSVVPQDHGFIDLEDRRGVVEVLQQALSGEKYLPNQRYQFLNISDVEKVSRELWSREGYNKVARYQVCDGAFNINSTSVNAWRAFLSSLNGREVLRLPAELDFSNSAGIHECIKSSGSILYPVSRFMLPNREPVMASEENSARVEFLEKRWAGARSLTGEQVNRIAHEIVSQVKQRGPFLSVAEFVNRRLEDSDLGKVGALQAAIDSTDINASFIQTSAQITAAETKNLDNSDFYENPAAMMGPVAQGAPGYVTQADFFMSLGPFLAARSDTFKVRTYGESKNGKGEVVATAYCEAAVQRFVDYIDPTNAPDIELVDALGNEVNVLSEVNREFGRRFRLLSFKWMSSQEV